MGCSRGSCPAEKAFLLVNLAFAMYAGALLATAARLMWDPSTYAWFRFLCAAQYRVSTAFVFAAGVWLAALVCLAAAAAPTPARARATRRPPYKSLNLYSWGVGVLCASEVSYGAWMGASLAAWWRSAPQAELARRAMDLAHDLKPALLAVERYKDVALPIYHMLEEVEREAPNNVFVIIAFAFFALILQIAAVVLAQRLCRRGRAGAGEKGAAGGGAAGGAAEKEACDDDDDEDDDSAASAPDQRHDPGWRKTANLRMYTILDKIF